MEIVNAIIVSPQIQIEDHGILTAWLNLDYGGTRQSFGGYGLYVPNHPDNAGKFIWRCLKVIGVRDWKELSNKTIRVKRENNQILAIGHIIEDRWFIPSEELR